MTIAFGAALDGAHDIITTFFDGFVQAGLLDMMPDHAKLDPQDVSVSDCVRLYYLQADDLASDQPLNNAKAGGWRHLLFSGGSVVTDVFLDLDDNQQPTVVSTSIDTPMAASTVTAIQVAEDDARISNHDYELRQLYCTGKVFIVALWLHCAAGDLIIPMAPSMVSGSMELHKIYAATDFIAWLKTEALPPA